MPCWCAGGEINDDEFSAPNLATKDSKSAYELRAYQIAPDKMLDVEEIMRNLVQPIMPDYDRKGVGYWANPDGTVLCYVLRHRDVEAIASDWDSFHADPRWKSGMAERKSKEPIVTQVETATLVGIPGLPLQQ